MTRFIEPHEAPEDFERFHDYCDRDVDTEVAAGRKMVPLSTEEWEVYHLNERINDRGLRIDTRTVRAAIRLAEQAKDAADREMALVTGGAVTACTQVGALVAWIQSRGVEVDSAAKADLEELLTRDLPPEVEEAVQLRLAAAKASVSKLQTLLDRTSSDGRYRGAFLYHGAGTGRFSSLGAQLHNLPRPRKVFEKAAIPPALACAAIRTAEPAWIEEMFGEKVGKPLHFIADAIRSFIWAAPGHEIMVADYSGIEGAVAAWFCREDWKVAALRELQSPAGKGKPDLYMRAAAGIYNVPAEEVGKGDKRQTGKVAELALQFQGSVGAFRAMARGYALNLVETHGPVWEAASDEWRERAVEQYETSLKRGHETAKTMQREAWIASRLIVDGWRSAHPAISASWKLLEGGCFQAVAEPGAQVQVLGVTFLVARGFLWMRLPSGRCLAYGNPQVRDVEVPWADKNEPPAAREKKPAVTVLGTSGGRMLRYPLYGGLLLENAVQAIARDLLVNGMLKVEAAGYPVIAHVHDEVLCEVKRGYGDDEDFARLLIELPAWAAGLPLAVGDVVRMKRYRKA